MRYNKYRITSAAALPESLQLEVSRRCSLRCPACRRTIQDPEGQGRLSVELLEKLEPVIAQADKLLITGWGEALEAGEIAWRTFELARWNRTNSCLATHGSRLTPEVCARLLESRVGHVTVSLDAGTPEGRRRLRPGSELESVVAGIRRLAGARDERGSTTPFISVAFNFHAGSAEEFPAFVRLAATLPVREAVVHPCFPYGGEEGEADARLPDWMRLQYEEGLAEAARLGLKVASFPAGFLERQLGIGEGEPGFHYLPSLAEIRGRALFPTCRCPWDLPFVDHAGGVHPCCHYPEPLGSLRENSFEEIWDGERFNWFRLGLVTHQPDPVCLRCRKTLWYHNRLGDYPAEHLPMSVDGLVGLGWYPPERIGRGAFRWSRGEATVYLQNTGKRKLYCIAMALRETRVEMRVEGQPVGPMTVRNYWGICSAELPKLDSPALRVSLRCPDAQEDPASRETQHRMRLLGIAVSQIGLCESEQDEEPRRGMRLIRPPALPVRLLKKGVGAWKRARLMW